MCPDEDLTEKRSLNSDILQAIRYHEPSRRGLLSMSDKKSADSSQKGQNNKDTFDDLEDAFFASGEASGFWDTEDEGAEQPADSEPSEPPEEALAAADAPETEGPATASVDEAEQFDSPSNLHHDPDNIADADTAVWATSTVGQALSSAPTQILGDDDEDDHPPMSSVLPADDAAAVDAKSYEPPDSEEDQWRQAAASLRRSAEHTEGKDRAWLLREAAQLLLSRVGDWEQASLFFNAAIEAGLTPEDTPKGYADVIASQGHFKALRDLLVARAEKVEGGAAIESLQDAAIVERTHLGNEPGAIDLLTRALALRSDWFTLRLLRELNYKTQDWAALAGNLDMMAELTDGARRARCKVEKGRILEVELRDLEGAKTAYADAIKAEPAFLEAFLAVTRVGRASQDSVTLARLYEREAERLDGASQAFWYARAARVSQSPDVEHSRTVHLYKQAMDKAASNTFFVHREAQAFFVNEGDLETLFFSLEAEASGQQVRERAATLLLLALLAAPHEAHAQTAIKAAQDAATADSSCTPAVDLAVDLLIRDGKAREALEYLKARTGETSPSTSVAHINFRIGEIAEHLLGDYATAASHYGEAATADPDHPFAAVSAALSLGYSGQWQAAATAFVSLAETSNDGDQAARWWLAAAQVYGLHLNDRGAAANAYTRAIDSAPLQPAALDGLVSTAMLGPDAQAKADALKLCSSHTPNSQDKVVSGYRAARILVDCIGDTEDARQLLARCADFDQQNPVVLGLLRSLAVRGGDWAAVYDLCMAQAKGTDTDEAFWALIMASNASLMLPGVDGAAVVNAALDLAPGSLAAFANLERTALTRGDSQGLVQAYRRARKEIDDPEYRTALTVRLADLNENAGEREHTARALTRALEASVGPRPYGAMARLAVAIENWPLAEAALHADGDHVGLARLLEATSDDHSRVATAWGTIINSEDGSPEAFAGLERTLTRMGSREGLAETHGQLAKIEKNPTIANMHALLAGHLFEHEENLQLAVEHYEIAFKNASYRGKAFDALVRIFIDTEDLDGIKRVFEQAGVEDQVALADALFDAGGITEALSIFKAGAKTPSIDSLPVMVRYEQALIANEQWQDLFEAIGQRASVTVDERELQLIEAQQRWVLSERMAGSDAAWDFYRRLHEERPGAADLVQCTGEAPPQPGWPPPLAVRGTC